MKALLASMCAASVLSAAGSALAQSSDYPRLRYGGALVGSLLVMPDPLAVTNDTLFLPGGGFDFHIGVQATSVLSFVYVQEPILAFFVSQRSHSPGVKPYNPEFVDYNAVLPQLTFKDVFEVGAGPSLALVEGPRRNDFSARFGVSSHLGYLIQGVKFMKRPPPRRTGISVELQNEVIRISTMMGAMFITCSGVVLNGVMACFGHRAIHAP
jgi:hypothetical protein